jgi:hypothetical protein
MSTRHHRSRNFAPDTYQRTEKKFLDRRTPHAISDEEIEYLNKFEGRIQLLTFTVFKITPDLPLNILRVFTPRAHVPLELIEDDLNSRFEKGCKINPCMSYHFSRSFDVQLQEFVPFEKFALAIVKSLERFV